MPKGLTEEEFSTCRDVYTQRLDRLKAELIEILTEARQGLRGQCESLERIEEIDKEVKGIIECAHVMNYLRRL